MALPAAGVWEIRSTGNAANGGFFNPARGGTDFSQSDTPVVSVTDAVANGTTTVTSATASFNGTTHPGNGVCIAGAWYELISVTNATTIVVDRTITTATGLTLKVGGAMDHPATAGGSYITGQTLQVKLGGSNYLHGSTANVSGGRLNTAAALTILGYTATRGDDAPTRPVMQANASTITIWTVSGGNSTIRNIDFYRDPAAGQTNVGGLSIGQTGSVERCRARNMNVGIGPVGGLGTSSVGTTFRDCQADACAVGFGNQSASTSYLCCVATACTTVGFYNSAGNGSNYHRCLAVNCATGFTVAGGSILAWCDAIGSTTNGFDGVAAVRAIRCRAESTSGSNYGFHGSIRLVECSGYNNGTGGTQHYDNAAGAGVESFVTLTAASSTNPAGLDFSINNVAGGGALIRGIPRTFPGLAGTSYPDVGAYQHADPVVETCVAY